MDNLEEKLSGIQNQINSLNELLANAQNQKIKSEVQLQNEQQEYDAIHKELQTITGLTDINDIHEYMNSKKEELDNIMNDLSKMSAHVNESYTFTNDDVQVLKDLINKYNIPISTE